MSGARFITILNTDDWPVSLSRPENVSLYHEDGIAVFEATLRASGVFVTHTTRRDDGLESRLRERFQSVARIGVPVELGAETELQHVYRGRRSSIGGGAG